MVSVALRMLLHRPTRLAATVQALVGPGDVVLGDELNHASIVDGCVLSGASFSKFRHNDTGHVASLLKEFSGRKTPVVVDGVYSMGGTSLHFQRLSICANDTMLD